VTDALKTALAALLLSLPALAATPDDSDWSQFRGSKRDGHSPDTGLLKQWPSSGPALAWKATGLGGGYSTVSIQGDRIFTMGDVGDSCVLIALNAADGKTVWTAPVGRTGGNYPGPRCTPSADGKLVVALGQHGDLICVSQADGKEVWRKSMKKDFDGRMMSGWGYSESPFIDGDLILCAPGGSKGSVIALKKTTGEVVWRCTDLTDSATYASIVPVEIGGVKQYLVLLENSVAGVAADGGKLLWRGERVIQKATAIATTPVYKDGVVFVTSSYEHGTCNGFKITKDGASFKAEQIYSGMQLKTHHGGVVVVGDHVYGTDNRSLKCLDLKTGNVIWEDRSVGKGSITYADGHLIVRSEGKQGSVALVEASPGGYKEKGRFDQPERSKLNSWPYPVVFGGKLYLRDQENLFCYDVKAK
jgi:outer membrane protein assembly factor BamB